MNANPPGGSTARVAVQDQADETARGLGKLITAIVPAGPALVYAVFRALHVLGCWC